MLWQESAHRGLWGFQLVALNQTHRKVGSSEVARERVLRLRAAASYHACCLNNFLRGQFLPTDVHDGLDRAQSRSANACAVSCRV